MSARAGAEGIPATATVTAVRHAEDRALREPALDTAGW